MSEALNIRSLLKINENNVEDELCAIAGFFFNYSCLALDAEDIYDSATMALELYEAELAKKIEPQLKEGRNKSNPVTQKEIEREFRLDDKWKRLREEQLKCRKNYRQLEKGCKAFEMKLTALANLNKRQIKTIGGRE